MKIINYFLRLKKKHWVYISICGLILLFGLIYYISNSHNNSPDVQTVSIEIVGYTAIPKTVVAYGQVVSPSSVTVRAQTSGIIIGIHFSPGQQVKKGQLLFTLSSNDESAQLAQYSEKLAATKDKYNRYKNLEKMNEGFVSKSQLVELKSEYMQALAQYNEAESIHNVVSPIDGMISDTSVTEGTFVNDGDALAYIANLQNKLQLRYQLPAIYFDQVALGQKVNFTPLNSSNTYSAEVSYISPALDPNDFNITLRADLSSGDILVNSFGNVLQVLIPDFKVIAVSQSLIQTDTDGFFVYILSDQNKIEKQYCILGDLMEAGLITIKDGIKIGTKIITANPDTFQIGQTAKGASQ